MIDMGQNDILEALYASNLTYAPVAAQVPSFVAETKLNIQVSIIYLDVILCFLFFYMYQPSEPTCLTFILEM